MHIRVKPHVLNELSALVLQPKTWQQRMHWSIPALLVTGYLFLASMLSEHIVSRHPMANTDFFTFWAAGHLIAARQNPYDTAEWVATHQAAGSTSMPNPTFVYPLPLALLFAPLGILSVATAAK